MRKARIMVCRRSQSPEERAELMKNDMFTTGDIAFLCRVAQKTVCDWFDKGLLKGFKIPGSPDRRIPRACLAEFLKTHDMGFTLDCPSDVRVLCIGFPHNVFERILAATIGNLEFFEATSSFAAGTMLSTCRPTHAVIDLGMGRIDSMTVAMGCKAQSPELQLIGFGTETEWALGQHGFGRIVRTVDELVRAVMERKAAK